MRENSIAIRYAKAMLSYAISQKSEAVVAADMEAIESTLTSEKDLKKSLENPILSGAQKQKLLETVFKNSNPVSVRLFSLLKENNRISYLSAVSTAYLSLYEAHLGNARAVVTTAVPITAALESKVLEKAKQLTKQKVTLENKVNADILGGFVLNMGDMQYDASVAFQLKKLERKLTNNTNK